ncbi:sodium/potassium/calcium exchanger 1-like [Rhopilema esculentum]|uniref:sodium/potassium/calcium exchanger 1-like n=1 Tax=Rhopilema esculentum TaxID=499914 RepID=UPI0031D97C39
MALNGNFRRQKSHAWLKRSILLIATFLLCTKFFAKKSFIQSEKVDSKNWLDNSVVSRKLLSTVEWEKCDYELGFARNYSKPTSEWHSPSTAYLWIGLYVFLIFAVFVALAIVCDDFFVPSLEVISEKLDLSEDVAGATFMAAGSSAPELFTSIAGVTVESDVGVGTIVGSAVFNLLGIVALSAAFAGKTLCLDWRPLARDSTFYALSIVLFIMFAWDGKFYLYESIIMLSLYILYISIMKVNYKLMELLAKCSRKAPIHPSHGEGKETTLAFSHSEKANAEDFTNCVSPTRSTEQHEHTRNALGERSETASPVESSRRFSHLKRGELTHTIIGAHDGVGRRPSFISESHEDRRTGSLLHSENSIDIKEKENLDLSCTRSTEPITNGSFQSKCDPKDLEESKSDAKEDENEEGIKVCSCFPPIKTEIPSRDEGKRGCISLIKIILHWILFLVSFPFVVGFSWTVPDCSKPKLQRYFIVSFVMSVFWIAALSFAMVTLVGRAGCILGVDKFTMGLVVVAIGTSIPDALSSILVARDGYGDMAVSNAIGSNVFDIDLGLGLPFVISILIRKMKPVLLLTPKEEEDYKSGKIIMIPHVKFGFLLLLILLLSIISFAIARFKMNKKLGIVFVILYICFVAYAYIQDIYCNNNC